MGNSQRQGERSEEIQNLALSLLETALPAIHGDGCDPVAPEDIKDIKDIRFRLLHM
jgi:hypothetical protein